MLNNASSDYRSVNEIFEVNQAEQDSEDNDNAEAENMDQDVLSHENILELQRNVNPMSHSSIWGIARCVCISFKFCIIIIIGNASYYVYIAV